MSIVLTFTTENELGARFANYGATATNLESARREGFDPRPKPKSAAGFDCANELARVLKRL